MTLCIVSPHLDDAVLSCGILMQRAAKDGETVRILNIFSQGTNSTARQDEDRKAVRLLGAEPFFLNELDAPDRNPIYEDGREIFFGSLDAVPQGEIDHIAALCADFFERHQVTKAVFPLGAGNHIDHRIVHAAGRKIKNTGVIYYEDRPYILWPGILTGRMNHLKAQTDLAPVGSDEMTATLGLYYYQDKLPKGAFGPEMLEGYLQGLTPPASYAHTAEVIERFKANAAELNMLFRALDQYGSQMPLIFPDYTRFLKDSLDHEKRRTGSEEYIERYWVISP